MRQAHYVTPTEVNQAASLSDSVNSFRHRIRGGNRKAVVRYAIGRGFDPVVVSYLLRFLSHFSLYYCHLFSITSLSVIIYIQRP